MARNWIRKPRFPEGRWLARVPESVCGRMGARTFSPWFSRVFTERKNSIRILLRSGCCQIFKIQNRHREVSCVIQDHMSCQWPTVIRKGRTSPRATQLWSDPSGRVGEVLTHLLYGPLEPRCILMPPWGDAETTGGGGRNITGTGTLTCHEPKLPPATATSPLSKGAREATTKGRWYGFARACVVRWYRGSGLPSCNASLLFLQIEGSAQF